MPAVSHWWEQIGGPPPPRPGLTGPREADVCIVGAGYTGLWTAVALRQARPSLDVVVLEREYAGFGASGRNGGWVVGALTGSRARWIARAGHGRALALVRAAHATVDEVGRFVADEGIECDFVKGGSLHVAQSKPELVRIRARVDADRAFGLGEDDVALLDADATRQRVRVAGALGARFTPHCARMQPAKLVRGLAESAERRGATIYEGTAVTAIEPHVARTARGDVRARWIVRATEGYTATLPGLRRVVMPVNSAMIATQPLGADAWRELGWDGLETILTGRHLYAYLQRTADGRIAIGGRGIPYRFGSKTAREDPLPQETRAELRSELVRLFGSAADAGIDAAWHGVLGVTRTWEPSVGADPSTGIAWALGYAGEGVAAANLAARTLRDLVLDEPSELTRLPWVGPPARRWEPEPLRYLGINAVYALLRSADRIEARTGRPSARATLGNRLAGRAQ